MVDCIIWSKRAKLELADILEFFHQRNGSKKYSRKLYKRFTNALKLVLVHPNIGTRTDIELVRGIVDGDYVIFYRVNEKSIEVISIWDSRQNPEHSPTS